MRAARFKSSSIIDKAVVDLVSLSAHKWQCNKRSSKSATMPSMHTIYHAYATVPSLRRHIHTSAHSHSHPHPYSYRWKLRSIWMCRCKHMLNWIEIEFAILCAAANAIFFAVREAPSRLPSHSHTLPPPSHSLTLLLLVFLFYLPWGGESPDMVMNLVGRKLCPPATVFDS